MKTGFWLILFALLLVLFASGCPAPEDETPETPAANGAMDTPERPVAEPPAEPPAMEEEDAGMEGEGGEGMNQTGAIEDLSATQITVNGTVYNILGTTEWLDADGNQWAIESFHVGDNVLIEGTADGSGGWNATRVKMDNAAEDTGMADDEDDAGEAEEEDPGAEGDADGAAGEAEGDPANPCNPCEG